MSADNRPALPLLPDLQDQADACLTKENGLERTALQPAELALGMLPFSSEPPEGASMHAWAQKVLDGLSTHDTRITGTWRGMLAFVLLADVLPEPLKLRASMLPAFSTAVGNAALRLLPESFVWKDAFLLTAGYQLGEAAVGLCSGRWCFLPAADQRELSAMLPESVIWYDRKKGEFLDPCEMLDDSAAAVLLNRLQLIQSAAELNEAASAVITEFIDDCKKALSFSAKSLNEGIAAETAYQLRLTAILGMNAKAGFTAVSSQRYSYRPSEGNVLLKSLHLDEPTLPSPSPRTIWSWRGIPFARVDRSIGVTAIGGDRAKPVLKQIEKELGMLRTQLPEWLHQTGEAFSSFLESHPSLCEKSKALLQKWADQYHKEYDDADISGTGSLELIWPWEPDSDAARLILQAGLDDESVQAAIQPFSDRLAVIPDCPEDAIGDTLLRPHCVIWCDAPVRAMALPPVSEKLAILQSRAYGSSGQTGKAARFLPESLMFRQTVTDQNENGILCAFSLQGNREVRFLRFYSESEILTVNPEDLPEISIWPCMTFRENAWKAYHVLQSASAAVSASVFAAGKPLSQGSLHGAWGMRTDRFPDMLVLYAEDTQIAMLPNHAPVLTNDAQEHAAAAIDLGDSSTAVALRIGSSLLPMSGPILQKTLLHGEKPGGLPIIQADAIYRTALSAAGADCNQPVPILDVCIPQEGSVPEILLCGLKWGSDADREKLLLAYLEQIMLVASLTALTHGASDICWRIAYPDSMAASARRTYLNIASAAARETARLTGLFNPAGEAPVSGMTEALAEICFFRNSQESGFRGGLLTLDLGAASAESALWLRSMKSPVSLISTADGLRTRLMESLCSQPEEWRSDLSALEDSGALDAWTDLILSTPKAGCDPSCYAAFGYRLDSCLIQYGLPLMRYLNMAYFAGRCTLPMALLLYHACSAFFLCGLTLEQAYQNSTQNDLLPTVLPFVLSGRGSLTIAAMEAPLQNRIGQFMRLPLSSMHPVQSIQMIFSSAPKMETAFGLLSADAFADTFPEDPRRAVLKTRTPGQPEFLAEQFLWLFHVSFPMAAEKLFPGLFTEKGLPDPACAPAIAALVQSAFSKPAASVQATWSVLLSSLLRDLPR